MSKLFLKNTQSFWLILTLIWIGVIGVFSSMPYSFDQTAPLFGPWNLEVRKLAHILEYAFLTLLWFRVWKFLPWAVMSALVCAGIDEYYQSFIPGRGSSIQDVGVDSIGILIAWVLIKAKKS